jgi:hypothetical protein
LVEQRSDHGAGVCALELSVEKYCCRNIADEPIRNVAIAITFTVTTTAVTTIPIPIVGGRGIIGAKAIRGLLSVGATNCGVSE